MVRFSAARPGASNVLHLSKDAARRILAEGHHRHQQSNMQRVATALGASGPNLLQPHFTASPLSSATLLAAFIKHRVLRSGEHMSTVVIRRTLDYVSERDKVWEHDTDQHARRVQCEQLMAHLEQRRSVATLRLQFNEDSAALQEELAGIEMQLRKLRLVTEHLQDRVRGSLHPSSLLQGDRVFLTPTEAAQLPSPLATVRGILIRIKGPRRGNRAWTWQKSAGRISTNSVDYVVAEEAKVGIPSKLGIFGLTVRIVYARKNRLIDCRTPLNVLDAPNFTFLQQQQRRQ